MGAYHIKIIEKNYALKIILAFRSMIIRLRIWRWLPGAVKEIEIAETEMPGLMAIRREYEGKQLS